MIGRRSDVGGTLAFEGTFVEQLSECPVCGSSEFRSHFSGRTTRRASDPTLWTVDRCTRCGHGFINPQPTWEELAPYYDENYAPYQPDHCATEDDERMAQRAREEGRYRHLPLPIGKKVLDIGCGGGHFLRICRLLGAESVTGVEPSVLGATTAKSAGLKVHTGTMDSFVGSADSQFRFDVITANHVLEHVPRPTETMRQIRSVLAEGGLIWIAVPNSACQSAERLGARWHSADIPYHLMQFTPQSLRKCAERAELVVKRLYTYSLPMAVRASMQSELRARWRIPLKISRYLISQDNADARARALDESNCGEAIICELTRA